jgi:hypothetical protein
MVCRIALLAAAVIFAVSPARSADKPLPRDKSSSAGKPAMSDQPAMSETKPMKSPDKSGKPPNKNGKDAGKTSKTSVIGASAKLPPPSRDFASVSRAIDSTIDQRLAEAHIPTSPLADDAEFFRRVTIDIIGRIPTYQETTWFLTSTDPDKRGKWIEDLLASRGYGEHFRDIWENLIDPKNDSVGHADHQQFGPWLAEQFNQNRGWNQIVADLLSAQGEIAQTPQAGFVMANSANAQPQPDKLAIATSRLFLGVHLECAQCHDHPFAPVKQEEFWAVAAFFSRVRNSNVKGGANRTAKLFECSLADDNAAIKGDTATFRIAGDGAIVIPPAFRGAGTPVKPKLLGGDVISLGDDGPYRQRFAEWVTSPENPYFTKAAVNRLWSQFFGRGLLNPIDDLPLDGKSTSVHTDLLQGMAKEFAASGFDQKHLIRAICNSQAYQRTSRTTSENENDRDLFSHMSLKPMTPEVMYDSLLDLTNVGQLKPAEPYRKGGARDPRGIFAEQFHVAANATDPSALGYGIPQFLRRMNAQPLNVDPAAFNRLGLSRTSREQAIEAIYVTALSRVPSADESKLMSDYVAKRSSADEGYEGVLWILLNSGEFVLNH